MKTLSFSLLSLFSAIAAMAETPKGLADSDWGSIQAAYEAGRHKFHCQADGSHEARNPGQGWKMAFDARGFSVTPDDGTWSWGLELVVDGSSNKEPAVSIVAVNPQKTNTLTFQRTAAIQEWYVNDQRGLEQGWTLSAPAEIRLKVRGGLKPSVSAQTVSFGGTINYGGLKAWDKNGRPVQTWFEPAEDGFKVRYDDASAQYPITIDPIAQQAYLKASSTGAGDHFGEAVAISGDTVVVGAPYEDSNATGVNGYEYDNSASNSGAAYVFVRSGSSWSQQAYLKASNTGGGDNFGYSLAVSGDTVVVGAPYEDSYATGTNGYEHNNGATDAGAAYVFVRSGNTWSQQSYLKASNTQVSDWFGSTVAISGDTVVVGAGGEDSNATGVNGYEYDNSASDSGAAYVFVRGGSTWSQQAYLKASNTEAVDYFGTSVAVSGDTIVVGAPFEDSNGTGINGNQADNSAGVAGAAYVFVRSAGTWSQQAYLKASNTGAFDFFGYSTAVSGDTVVVGAYGEASDARGVNGNPANNTASESGAAYVFVRSAGIWNQQAYLKASNTGTSDYFGRSVAVSGDTVAVGAWNEDSNGTGVNGNQADNSASDSGAAYVFVRGGGTWTQQAYLKSSNTKANDWFGRSVAVSGDTVVVGGSRESSNSSGVNGDQSNNNASESGAAYVVKGFGPEPDISVASPGNNPISSGGTRDLGNVLTNGNNVTFPFVVSNSGTGALTGLGLTITGTGASHFSVVTSPTAPVAPGGSTTVEIKFQPTTVGPKTALLQVASNDPDENPYQITLTGTGMLPPAVPALVSPGSKTAPGRTITTLTPTFTWKAVSGAVAYNFTLREAGGLLLHSETGIGATTSYALPAGHLRPGGRYQWTMRARNAGGPGLESAPFYFVVADEPTAVPQPVLMTPGSSDPTKTVLNTLTPTFRWKPVAGALGLTITLRDTGSNSDVPLLLDDAVGTGISYTIAPGILQPDKSYRWTLRGRNGLGEGRWALPFYFSTAPAVTLPTAPVPVNPGGTTLPRATIYDPDAVGARPLEWKPVTGATGYKVKLWPAGAGAEIHSADVAAGTVTYSLPTSLLTQNQACRWTVSTVVGDLESLPSASRFFRTPAVYPAPVITSFRPTQVVASTSSQWVLLQGDDFRSGAKVLQTYGTKTDLPATSSNVQFYTAGIRVRITTGMVAGNWTFKLLNPDGKVSNAVTLPVVLPASTVLTPPVATPPPGTYEQPVSVVLSHSNGAGVNIHYTDDGTLPDLSSPLYDTEPILLGAKTPVRLQAVALDETRTAARMVPATYRFNLPQLKFEEYSDPKFLSTGDKYYYKVVVPAGLASFDVFTRVPQGRVDMFLAKGRLPTVESHDFKSVAEPSSGGDEVQAIRSQRVSDGTYFVLVHCKESVEVRIGMLATKGTVTAQPTISPGKGAHAAPLQVSIEHPDPDATIYYTVDSTAAKTPDAGNLGSGTLTYQGPFLLSNNAYVSAVAQSPGKSVSKVTTTFYEVGVFDNDTTTPGHLSLVLAPEVTSGDLIPTRTATADFVVNWGGKNDQSRTYTFSFSTPPDPFYRQGAAQPSIEYPVALEIIAKGPLGGKMYVSLSRANATLSSLSFPVKAEDLPHLGMRVRLDVTPVFGALQGSKGQPLVPGATYYGSLNITASSLTSVVPSSAKLQLRLHSAKLTRPQLSDILPAKRTWIVSHGRQTTSEFSPQITELSKALDNAIAGRPAIGEQVLSLNWGSMALEPGVSFDSALFTEPVGRRTAEVMKKWAITPDKTSLIGHSWGTYVCYEYAKSTKSMVQRLIALDPAFTGNGGYSDSQINFRRYSTRSWAFVSDYSVLPLVWTLPLGNSFYAGTAHESFFVGPSMVNFSQLHALPLELFTEFLTRAYRVAPTDPVANFFAIDKLDSVPLARFKENNSHEGSITVGHGPDADHALDVSAPITLRYTNRELQLQTLTSPGRTP